MDERSREERAAAPAMTGDDWLTVLASGALIVGIAVAAAVIAFGQATVDWRYQLAGIADPFLGRPAPGWTIAWYAAGSVVVAVVALTWLYLTRAERSADRRPRRVRLLAPRWWWVLGGLWGGYLAGALVTVAAGGPEVRPGTIRLELGAPLGLSAESPAACTTAPGSPGTVVSLAADARDVPLLHLRNLATGEPTPYPYPGAANLEPRYGTGDPLAIAGLPARPPVLSLGMGFHMQPDTAGRWFITETPISFLAAYDYGPLTTASDASSGRATFRATRSHGLFAVDDMLPDDPWPETWDLALTWRCDLSGPAPAPAPARGPGEPQASLAWPTAPPAGAPAPVELRLATSATQASIEITGATVAGIELVSTGGPGHARYADGRFTVRQTASAAAAGEVTLATYRLTLSGVAAEADVGLTIAGGPEGRVAVTLYNLLGPEPVPVFANSGTSADRPGWPIQVKGSLLTEPVAVQVQP